MSEDCVFCGIADGDMPASVVMETDATLAFLDLNPINEGHTLVISKRHSDALAGLDEKNGGKLFQVGMRVAAALRESDIPTDGINFFLADGEAAGQEVFHVHLHVIPRTVGDDVHIAAHQERADREDLDAVAERLEALL
jgi:diadenosine tetraphosphate (Ap4A) HIT family hydrolase